MPQEHQAEAVGAIKEAVVRRLRELRDECKEPARTAETSAKRGAKVAKEAAARIAWENRADGSVDAATNAL